MEQQLDLIRVIQPLSPQIRQGHPKFMPEAKVGDILVGKCLTVGDTTFYVLVRE